MPVGWAAAPFFQQQRGQVPTASGFLGRSRKREKNSRDGQLMTSIPTPIYHITHINNLASIRAAGGLRSLNLMRLARTGYTNIAYFGIQYRRATTQVPCGAGGTLHDYVPFYFAPRSPMLYTIHRGNVGGYDQGQGPIVHLVSTAEAVRTAGLSFVFTDGHGTIALTEFFDDLAQLNQVHWEVMESRYWFDTPEDCDRKRRRQAEFLVHNFFPWQLVTEIGVIDPTMRAQVVRLLQNATHQPAVTVHPDWYY